MDTVFSVLFPLLLITVLPGWLCFTSCCKCGSMTPRDPYILLDSELVLNCTLNSSAPVDSSKLYFSRKPNNLSIPERDIPMNYTSIINKKTISLRKTMRSLEEAGYYYCKIRNVPQSINMVDRQMVELEYPLRNVSDFHCEIYDWVVKKTCTWDLGYYVNPNNINVTLYGNDGGWHRCPKMLNNQQCFWDQEKDDLGLNLSGPWEYAVIIKNTKLSKSTYTQHSIGDLTTIVRPAPVKFFNVYNTKDKDCVNVTWDYNRPNFTQAVEIRYSKHQGIKSPVKTLILKNSAVNATICNLTAYTDYMFEIRVKPQNYDGKITGYWSNSTRKLFQAIDETCNPGSYGKDCKEVCGHCEGNELCNHINGSCPGSCEPGYKGELCLTKCGSGRYGRNCNSTCGHCANNVTCDPITGACPECAPGWTDLGDNKCNRVCNDGWYGRECKQRCGYCRDDEPCHHVTGSCSGFCEPGYLGDKCDESEFSQLLAIQRKMLNSVRELLSFKRRKVGLIANITSPTDLK